jgi:DNA-binding winged helix-turn-helix (wHTH) protein/Tol biopolymer transport system component
MKPLTIHNFRFDDFELDCAKRLLFKQGIPVSLNPKTFDLLEILVNRRGEVLSKDELLEKVWDGQFVEESNLTVHVSTLRKILGETRGENRFIITVPGKGYKFVGETAIEEVKKQKAKGKGSERKFSYLYLLPFAFLLLLGSGYYLSRSQKQADEKSFAKTQIRQLTNNGKVKTAALSPDGKLFAYVTDDFGQETLWLGQTDGGNNIELLPPAEVSYEAPVFSPESDKLYFSVFDRSNRSFALLRMPVFGGAQEKILEGIGGFALSPDGKQIAFGRFKTDVDEYFLIVRNLDDGAEKEILAPFQVLFKSLSFSPDGKNLAFAAITDEAKQSAFKAEIDSGEVMQITAQNFGEINKTLWMADGKGLIITALGTDSWSAVPQFRVWDISLPNGETHQITNDLSSYSDALSLSKDSLLTIEHRQMNNVWVAPSDKLSQAKQITFGSFGRYDGLWGLGWMPDGRIIFNSSNTESQVISEMNADGSGQRQLTAPGHIDSDLDVSNDGRYIVFHSTRGGGFDIWRIDANGDHPTQLTFGKQNYQPAISADSRFVYYKSMVNGIGELRRMSMDGGESTALTDKETSWFAESPDGKQIAALYRTDHSRLAIFQTSGGQPLKSFDLPKSATLYGGAHWTPDGKSFVYYDQNFGYWKQSIEGGEPTRIENLPKERLYNFAWSKDGKQFAFVRGQVNRDVIMISDF